MAAPEELTDPVLLKEYTLGCTDDEIAEKYGTGADEVVRRRHAIGLHRVSPQ